jgi:hypothetical protein
LVSLVVFLTSVSTCILFLPFFLLAFDVNGQTNLIFVLLSVNKLQMLISVLKQMAELMATSNESSKCVENSAVYELYCVT